MKFWQKMYLSVLLLFLVVFNIFILSFANSVYQKNLDSIRILVNRDFSSFKSSFQKDMKELKTRRSLSDELVFVLFNSYANISRKQDVFLELQKNTHPLFSNLPFSSEHILVRFHDDSQKAVIYRNDNMNYYCIRSSLSEPFSEYTLVYIFPLTELESYFDQLAGKSLFAALSLSFLLALVLFFLSKGLTAPLLKLAKASQIIASGNYSQKLTITGNDEFAEVSRHFNNMAVEIEKKIALLQEENIKKQLLIDSMAHELNTPLTSIQGYAQYMLIAESDEQERYEALTYILKESKRLSLLGEQLRLLLETRNMELLYEKVNLLELLHTVIQMLHFQLEEKQITLTAPSRSAYFCCDITLITSLFRNIIENAIHACQYGGNILINFEHTNERLVIQIKDDGQGISEEDLEHITEPFYRIDKARSRSEGGCGLGLSLCKQIVQRHHGTLSFLSEKGNGTTVCLLFTTSLQLS